VDLVFGHIRLGHLQACTVSRGLFSTNAIRPLFQALRKLLELQASTAILIQLDSKGEVAAEKEIAIELVQVNDLLKVWIWMSCQRGCSFPHWQPGRYWFSRCYGGTAVRFCFNLCRDACWARIVC
jgi:hypothetical protein